MRDEMESFEDYSSRKGGSGSLKIKLDDKGRSRIVPRGRISPLS